MSDPKLAAVSGQGIFDHLDRLVHYGQPARCGRFRRRGVRSLVHRNPL
jgi:hypothetical protein